MPVTFRTEPYRFGFIRVSTTSQPHTHVTRDNHEAKFWPEPVELAYNWGFPRHEVNRIEGTVVERREQLSEHWHDYFR